MGRNSEGQAHIHPAAVTLDRRVEKSSDLREGHDFVEFPFNLGASHSEDCAIQKNVFATGQFRMKPGADFEERANATVDVDSAGGGLGDAVQDFQQRALARAITSDNPEHSTSFDVE